MESPSCVHRKLINKISVQDFWRPSIAGSSLDNSPLCLVAGKLLFELLLRLFTDIIGIRLSHMFRVHALIWKNKEWVLTYILSKPPRLELYNDITFIYGHKAPPPPGNRPFLFPSLSSLLSFTPFITPFLHSFIIMDITSILNSDPALSISVSRDLLKHSIWFHIQSYTCLPTGSGRQWGSLFILSLDERAPE